MTRVGFWSPCLYRAGGTETFHCTLLPGLARTPGITLTGLGVQNADECDPTTAERIRKVCPVLTGIHGLSEVAAASDVVVFWGIQDPRWFLGTGDRPALVMTSHGDGKDGWTAATMLACSPYADRYVVVSRAAIGTVPEHRLKDATVIPNAVDPDKLTPKLSRAEQRRKWNVPGRAKVVGIVSRLSDEKDPKALNRAVAALPPEWVGVAVGDGPDHVDAMADAFATCGSRVYFPGATDDAASAYGALDVLLCPSTSEGFGLTIVEGLAAGVPVVSTPVGIARDYPVSSLIFPVPVGADGPTLAEAVLKADADGPQNAKHAAWFVRREYSAERFVAGWADLIRGVKRVQV